MKRTLVFAVSLILMTFFLCSCGQSSKGIGETGISADEFSQLLTGMSQEKVNSIIGGKGDLISESKDEDDNYLYYNKVYRYEGETGGYAELSFTHKVPKGLYRGGSDDFMVILNSKSKYDLK